MGWAQDRLRVLGCQKRREEYGNVSERASESGGAGFSRLFCVEWSGERKEPGREDRRSEWWSRSG
jgi:hypothetical protein